MVTTILGADAPMANYIHRWNGTEFIRMVTIDAPSESGGEYLWRPKFDSDGNMWFGGYANIEAGWSFYTPGLSRYSTSDGTFTRLSLSEEMGWVMGHIVVGDTVWATGGVYDASTWKLNSAVWAGDIDGPMELVDSYGFSSLDTSNSWTGAIAVDPDGEIWLTGKGEDDLDIFHSFVRIGDEDGFDTVYSSVMDSTSDHYDELNGAVFDQDGQFWSALHTLTDASELTSPLDNWRALTGSYTAPGELDWMDSFEWSGEPAGALSVGVHPTGDVFMAGVASDGIAEQNILIRAGGTDGFYTAQFVELEVGSRIGFEPMSITSDGAVWMSMFNLEASGDGAYEVYRLSCD
jgi:streptogramin lyase